MTPKAFVDGIVRNVIDDNNASYQEMFAAASEACPDPYWQQALGFFATLTNEQRAALFHVVRQVSVDTVSTMFGILDGVVAFEGDGANFTLTHGASQKLNGNLQDLFLAAEEKREKNIPSSPL